MKPAVLDTKTAIAKGLNNTPSSSARPTPIGYIKAAAALFEISSVITRVMEYTNNNAAKFVGSEAEIDFAIVVARPEVVMEVANDNEAPNNINNRMSTITGISSGTIQPPMKKKAVRARAAGQISIVSQATKINIAMKQITGKRV